jgi:hypothetical protein
MLVECSRDLKSASSVGSPEIPPKREPLSWEIQPRWTSRFVIAHFRRAVGSVDLEQIMSDKDLRNASSFVVKVGVDRAFQDVVAPRIELAYLRPADAASDPRPAPLLKSASLCAEVDEQGRPRP